MSNNIAAHGGLGAAGVHVLKMLDCRSVVKGRLISPDQAFQAWCAALNSQLIFIQARMTLTPLLVAPAVIQVHALAALLALGLGLVQLCLPKGTLPHRGFGWLWVILMAVTALSSFWIHTICLVGPFSPIHLLSILTLLTLPVAVMRARRHQIGQHARTMQILFLGALVIAGLFTLLPGRIMHDVVFGTTSAHGTCTG